MTKKELIEQYNKGKIREVASTHITNNSGIAICHIEHGIEDKVFGFISYGDKKDFFFVKLHHLATKTIFNVGAMRFDTNDFIQI